MLTIRKKIALVLLLAVISTTSYSTIYFVSSQGNDSNSGTMKHPFLTIQKAQASVQPGDTVYVRGGVYTIQASQITSYTKIQAYVILLDKSGTDNKRINYWAYPGEKPVFDFSNVAPANYRVHAFEITGSWLHLKGLEVIGVQVTVTTSNTQSICFSNDGGSNNIYEQLNMHDGQGIGFFLTSGSNNLILNCDAYRNYDYISKAGGGVNGGNVDGFGCHPAKGSTGNVFRGCRAWFNSDDGYDCITAFESTIFENCWAFYNGYSLGFIRRADGNGFKAGGYASRPLPALPQPIPRNTVRFCLAVMNKSNGFYSNHHLEGSDWFNNTAYMNGTNYNMLNRKEKTEESYLVDGPGYNHVMKNNISFSPRGKDIDNIDTARCIIDQNSFWEDGLSVSAEDFVSLDTASLVAPRKADGSLPSIEFMQLKPASKLIDKGANTGLRFYGKAPDLGCFERKGK